MRKMAILGWLALAACGGGGQKPAETPATSQPALSNSVPAEPAPAKTQTELVVDKMRGFRDQVCRCRDSACVQKVSEEMNLWAQDLAKRSDDPPSMTEAQTKEMQEIGTQMGDCMVRAMQASGPPANTSANPCGGGP